MIYYGSQDPEHKKIVEFMETVKEDIVGVTFVGELGEWSVSVVYVSWSVAERRDLWIDRTSGKIKLDAVNPFHSIMIQVPSTLAQPSSNFAINSCVCSPDRGSARWSLAKQTISRLSWCRWKTHRLDHSYRSQTLEVERRPAVSVVEVCPRLIASKLSPISTAADLMVVLCSSLRMGHQLCGRDTLWGQGRKQGDIW